MIQGKVDQYHYEQEDIDETVQESSVGWVNNPALPKQHHSWDSDSSGDYLVQPIRSNNRTELKVAGAKMPIAINGKKTSVWVDSGSPKSIFTIEELRRTLGTSGVHLKELAPEDQDFRDKGNNPLSLLGTMQVQLTLNGWKTIATIKVIGGNRPSIIGRDLMPELGLQLVQKTPGERVMEIHYEHAEGEYAEGENNLDQWQDFFSKQFSKLFTRINKLRNHKVRAEFF